MKIRDNLRLEKVQESIITNENDLVLKSNFDKGDELLANLGIFKKIYKKTYPSILEVKNGGFIALEYGGKALFDQNYKIVHSQESGGYDLSLGKDIRSILEDFELRKSKQYPDVIFDLTSAGSALYSFWLLEALPKIYYFKKKYPELEKSTLLVNAISSFVRESLEMLGLNSVSIIQKNNTNHIFRSNLIVTLQNARSERYTQKWAIEYLRKSFLETKNSSPRKRIFICRQSAKSRRVVNWRECIEVLDRYGFISIDPASLNLKESISLISSAKIIMGVHGAGLANIIFCPPTATIIELFGAHYTTQYRILAQQLGLQYFALPCVNNDGLFINELFNKFSLTDRNKMDIVVSIPMLKESIERAENF